MTTFIVALIAFAAGCFVNRIISAARSALQYLKDIRDMGDER